MANTLVQRIRIRHITASIWEGTSSKGEPYRSITFERYRVVNDEAEYSNMFFRDDLLVLARTVERTFDWMIDNPIERPDRRRNTDTTDEAA